MCTHTCAVLLLGLATQDGRSQRLTVDSASPVSVLVPGCSWSLKVSVFLLSHLESQFVLRSSHLASDLVFDEVMNTTVTRTAKACSRSLTMLRMSQDQSTNTSPVKVSKQT